MSMVRLFTVIAATGLMLALAPPTALAATASTPYDLIQVDSPRGQPGGGFGERHAAAGDLNGDGVNDYLVGSPSQDVLASSSAANALTDAGRIWAYSGATRTPLYDLVSPEPQANAKFGFFISVLGDVNGNGKNDVAVGTDAQDTLADGRPCAAGDPGCNVDQGKAWVFDGRAGALLYELDNPDPQGSSRFGSRIGRAGDVTGDGVPESILGASNTDVGTGAAAPDGCAVDNVIEAGCRENQGRAYIFNGRTGALVRTLDLPSPVPGPTCDQKTAGSDNPKVTCGNFGLSVQGPGDVDGDGVTDQLVDAGNLSYETGTPGTACQSPGLAEPNGCFEGQGAMFLFSGKTGAPLARIDDPAPQVNVTFGFQDAAPLAPGDVNGDGRADLYANGFTQAGADGDPDEGRIWVFDGKKTVETGHGVVLYEPKDPTSTVGGQCCFSLDRTDYNKDGRPDLYVGQSPHHLDLGAGVVDESGGTYVFDGRNGGLLRSFELPAGVRQRGAGGFSNLGSNLGWSLAAPGDLNKDGEPDYVAGAPFQDLGDNKNQGASFTFMSKVPLVAPNPASLQGCVAAATKKVIALTSGNDTRNGTPGADLIFAGAGDDVVDALAGDDCVDLGPGRDRGQGGAGDDFLTGGLGDDTLTGSDGKDVLQGGPGVDRLFGSFGDDTLHGQSGSDRISGSRGRDRINGGSGRDRISGGSSADRVNGDAGNDRIAGNSSNDVLKGNSGNDRITGGTGRDRISGGSGKDRILARDGKRDRITCGRGFDRVVADRIDVVSRSCEKVRRRR